MAKILARSGMKIVLADLERPILEEAEVELKEEGTDVVSVVTDVGNR